MPHWAQLLQLISDLLRSLPEPVLDKTAFLTEGAEDTADDTDAMRQCLTHELHLLNTLLVTALASLQHMIRSSLPPKRRVCPSCKSLQSAGVRHRHSVMSLLSARSF